MANLVWGGVPLPRYIVGVRGGNEFFRIAAFWSQHDAEVFLGMLNDGGLLAGRYYIDDMQGD